MSVRPIFAWYDLWVGIFIDRPKHRVYIFPLPCIGIVITSPDTPTPTGEDRDPCPTCGYYGHPAAWHDTPTPTGQTP